MSKTDLSIPSLGDKFIDLRDQLPGDAYKWSWERDLSQVNYLAIHHTNGSENQTPYEIAQVHVNTNGWGGVGYHFLINKEGNVYYVGDISTARANVANMNEQVLGIGLIGQFNNDQTPTLEQLDAAHILCEFLLGYSDLVNVKSWDKLRGHKELPNQTTNCPGEGWDHWRIQIVEGVNSKVVKPQLLDEEKVEDQDDQLLQSQVDSLQASLASVNQQVFSLHEALQERDQQISQLKKSLAQSPFKLNEVPDSKKSKDNTLTIIQALINLYKFVFPPGKDASS